MKSKDELIQDLRNGKSINEVCTENKLTLKQLMSLTKKPAIQKLPKYISKCNKRYRITKHISGKKSQYYGSFKTLDEAKEVVKKLIKHNWELPPKDYLGMMYIHEKGQYYWIRKTINGKYRNIIRLDNLTDAKNVRDMLVKFDWDLDYLPIICKQLGVEQIGN